MTSPRSSQIGRFIWLVLLIALVVFLLVAAPGLLEELGARPEGGEAAASHATLGACLILLASLLATAILGSYVVRVDLLRAVETRWASMARARGDGEERLRGRGRWLLPLLLAAAAIAAIIIALCMRGSESQQGDGAIAGPFRGLGLSSLLWASILTCVILTIALGRAALRGVAQNRRESRHRRGKFTRKERAQIEVQRSSQERLAVALRFRDELLSKRLPQTIDVWDFRAADGEVFFQDAPATYGRYYGRDVSYSTTSGFFFGNPAFVVAGLAVTAMGNASAKSRAEREAAEQWREWQTARVLVSNQRLVCFAGGRWLSFWYSGVVVSYPSMRDRSLTLQFGDAEPLMLIGEHVPLAIVMATYSMHGERGLAGHPDLVAAAAAVDAPPPVVPGVVVPGT
ncbi:hypothetical protein [Pseudoclavibacter helvolus]|uniref:hypothetical protein n=1 Tax=Pseudoclavibacter helvolus TaxID=255205 RepID=UPI003C7597D5